MSLTDIVSASGTTGFAQVGFIISLVVFCLIVVWALLRPKASMRAAAQSVLRDGMSDESTIQKEEHRHGLG